jgi:hypothetical protein
MKIGITCYPTYGGSGVVATEMGKELAALGHEIHFISYAMPIKLNTTSELIHFHEVEMLNYPLFEHPLIPSLWPQNGGSGYQSGVGPPARPLRHSSLSQCLFGQADVAA